VPATSALIDSLMFPIRRLLPPMSLLCAFEAAARHRSFTAAAAELHLTQSAVSRQIRALEQKLETELFVRERQTVRLSAAGEAYVEEIRAALVRISNSTLVCRSNSQGGNLNLAILPTFGTRWLAPRLPRFFAEHPGVTVNLTTKLSQFDFRSEDVDAAIHFGSAHWPGADMVPLMRETLVPVCSPALQARYGFTTPADLLKAPLLHLASRQNAWSDWLSSHGVESEGFPRGMVFDQFATAAQAAIVGLGIALLPRFLITHELQTGDLRNVVPTVADFEGVDLYYLAWPNAKAGHVPLQAFRSWLLGEVEAFVRESAALPNHGAGHQSG